MMRRQFGTVSLYIVREVFISFAIAFLFFFFIFFVNQLLLMAEKILAKKVPLEDVILLVVYSIPIIVTYALPFGTLVGGLMAVGRLSSDNEILAFRASGIPLHRILIPLLIIGILFSLVSFVFGDFFLPLGNIRLKTMLKRIIFKNPGIEMESYSVKRYDNTVIIMGEVKGNRISSLIIIDRTEENKKRIITAREAFLEPNPRQRGAVSLRLKQVTSHVSDPREKGSYEYGSAESMIYNILLKDISVSMVNPGPAEKTSVDVWRAIREMNEKFRDRNEKREENIRRLRLDLAMEIEAALESLRSRQNLSEQRTEALNRSLENIEKEQKRPIFDRKRQSYLLEFQRKFASPLSCFVFLVFAFPVGLVARRSGRAVGFGIGIIMSGVYWGMLLVSYRLGSRMDFSPVLSMWSPNILVFLVGLSLIVRKVRA
jgi:lipopolysaccharide export system permease protein